MKIYLKKGKQVFTEGDRYTLGAGTEIIYIDKEFPGEKKTINDCGIVDKTCDTYKMHIKTIDLKKNIYPCDEVFCNEKVNVLESKKRLSEDVGGCKK